MNTDAPTSAPDEPDEEAIVAMCARAASRGLSPGLAREDLLQEGRLAIWQARCEGRVPADAVHARRYLARRALGAMIDANRAAWKQLPLTVNELGDDTPVQAVSAQPDTLLHLRQVLERVLARGAGRVGQCLELLARNYTQAQAARELGVSQSRISQLRRRARRIASHLW